MKKAVFTMLLCAVVPILSEDPPTITYTCETDDVGDHYSTITIPPKLLESGVSLMTGRHSSGNVCSYPTTGIVPILFTGTLKETCGIIKKNPHEPIFDVLLTTSKCPDVNAPCILDNDFEFQFTCNFLNMQQDVKLQNNFAVAGSAASGKSVIDGETMEMTIMELQGNLVESSFTSLGDWRHIRLALTLGSGDSAAKAFKVIDCSFHLPGSDVSLPFFTDGCTGISPLFTPGKKFIYHGIQSGVYYLMSPRFKAFVWPNSSDLMIQCTVEFCAAHADCSQICANSERKRRSILKGEQRKLFTLLHVATYNATSAAVRKSIPPNSIFVCNNYPYIIGLASLGFALAMTLMLTVGSFLLFKRSQPEKAKTAGVNHGA